MSDWNNRKSYDRVTREVFDATPDDLLPWLIHDSLFLKVGQEYSRLQEILEQLPTGYALVYHLYALDGEICNGGFEQYFFNNLDREAEAHMAALSWIGAEKHIKIFKKAFRIHKAEKTNKELQKRLAIRTLESFFSTYGMSRLSKCDDEWYALDDEFKRLLESFLRNHPDLCIHE